MAASIKIAERQFKTRWLEASRAVGADSAVVGFLLEPQVYHVAVTIDELYYVLRVLPQVIDEAYASETIPELVHQLMEEILDQNAEEILDA